MADYTIFKSPRYCPNASHTGYDKHSVSVGDLIMYEIEYTDGHTHRQLARVLGLVNKRLPDGSDPGKDTLVVLEADEMLSHAFVRYVKLDKVVRVRAPSKSGFASWFLSGPVPDPETAIAASSYGSLSDSYIDKYLEGGELRSTFRNIDKVRD
jgi:hypothetical protein